jgi:hypothetical protein
MFEREVMLPVDPESLMRTAGETTQNEPGGITAE